MYMDTHLCGKNTENVTVVTVILMYNKVNETFMSRSFTLTHKASIKIDESLSKKLLFHSFGQIEFIHNF